MVYDLWHCGIFHRSLTPEVPIKEHVRGEAVERGSVAAKRDLDLLRHRSPTALKRFSLNPHFNTPCMLSQTAVDLTFGGPIDDWVADPPARQRLYRAASVGNSWGVTSIGRGFDWDKSSDDTDDSPNEDHGSFLALPMPKHERSKSDYDAAKRRNIIAQNSAKLTRPVLTSSNSPPSSHIIPLLPNPLHALRSILTEHLSSEPSCLTYDQSRPNSPPPCTPGGTYRQQSMSGAHTPSGRPRSRRRSSQQRVSLVAGRVLIAPIDGPPSPIHFPQIHRAITPNTPIKAPPMTHSKSFLGERKISEFVIEKEIGRGAYGLVKRAREIQADGSTGVRWSF